MRPAHFLESLTDTYCPGRFAIKTEPIPQNGGAKTQWAQEQADLIIQYCIEIHEQSRASLERAFKLLTEQLKEDDKLSSQSGLFRHIFDEIKNACYPYIFIMEDDVRAALELQRVSESPVMLAPRDHMSTLAEPKVLRQYYTEQCRNLLNHGYRLEAGLSVVPIPVTYAVERSMIQQVPARKNMLQGIESYFPVPTLIEVEDSVVDGQYLRRERSVVVDHEYTLLNSIFWEEYKEFLRSGSWHQEFNRNQRSAMLVSDNLLKSRAKYLERRPDGSKRADGFAQVGSVVAPRGGRHRPGPLAGVRSSYQAPKSLSYFDAPRTDLSLSRLHYYTGTDAEYFQKSILAINYPLYARQFVLRAIAEIYRMGRDKSGKLVIAPSRQSQHPRGHILGFQEITELFQPVNEASAKKEGLDSKATEQDLKKVTDLLKDHTSAEKLALDKSYRKCLDAVAELIRSSEAQMPAYHYIAPLAKDPVNVTTMDPKIRREKIFETTDLPSMTIINIGVGPSNAKTITDHLAPLRPRCWIMVGRCSGLRKEQHVGDYVFATSYVRRDGVLDKRVPLDAPVKTTRAILRAFDEAMAYLADKEMLDAKNGSKSGIFFAREPTPEQAEALFHARRQKVRLGTVVATNDRNWETAPADELLEEFNAYRAVAIDMEGGVLAANGYRYRIHHGAFLCVSAKPLDGSVRIRQLQDNFYERQSARHLEYAIAAVRWLEYSFATRLLLEHSRELEGNDDPPWH